MRVATTSLVLFGALGALASACVLATSFDDFTRGGPATDGGPMTVPDGTGDADAQDGGGDADAGSEGASFCADASFCTTFPTTSLDGLGSTDITATAMLGIDSALATSAPNSLHAVMPPSKSADPLLARVTQHFTDAARRRIRVAVDAFVPSPTWPDGANNFAILEVGLIGSTRSYQTLYLGKGYATVTTSNGSALSYTNLSAPFPYDRWMRLVLDADFTPANGSVSLSIDGTTYASLAGIGFATGTTTELLSVIGISRYSGTTPAFDVRYDDLAVWLP